jgi:hypothetical protein
MLRGDYAAAWNICDRILSERMSRAEDCSIWPRQLQYVWRGSPIRNQRVLVRCFHGLGDTIQFVRLLAPLRAQAREVILLVQPALIDILDSVRGIDRMLPLHDGTPEVSYDVDVELMELAHVLRLTSASIPTHVPYIYVSNVDQRPQTTPKLRVGLAWCSGDWNPSRSIPEDLIAKLERLSNVEWHSLQYGAPPLPKSASVMVSKDIRMTARRMHSLDLVISVDTMTAHLAGALGLPVWTLLPTPCDWRWMSYGERSVWYPTMRLFRQPHPGDWASVVDQVRAMLSSQSSIPARGTRSVGCTAS